MESLLCRAGIVNNVDGIITSILGEFTYIDGTKSTEGPSSRNAGKGEATYVFSRDKTSCVKSVFISFVLKFDGESIDFQVQSDEAPAGKCHILLKWNLDYGALAPETGPASPRDSFILVRELVPIPGEVKGLVGNQII